MKRKWLWMVLWSLIVSTKVNACDICGCGVGNNYIGILPEFRKHIVGLRYRSNSMWTHLGVGGANTYLTTRERYRTFEAWGGWTINDKFRVMATIPYHFIDKENQGTTVSKAGIGDVSISGFYQLVNNRHMLTSSSLIVQSLWLGGGVKLPTGKYNPDDNRNTAKNSNLFQLGTGSVDLNLSGMYDLRIQDMGVNIAANYRMTTANRYNYKYGNKVNVNAQLYYKFRPSMQFSIAPNAGIQFENASLDTDKGFKVTVSGGNLTLGTIGLEGGIGSIAFGANYQFPLSQNLASGIVKANDRLMIHVGFTF
ncbi:MAG: transporter [Chitinophagaceae bacterium]